MATIRKLEKRKEAYEGKVEGMLGTSPKYKIPEEIYKLTSEYEKAGEEAIKGAETAYNIAKRRATTEMPGFQQTKSMLETQSSLALYKTMKMGGGRGAISDIYNQTTNALLNLSIQKASYKDIALQGLQEMALKRGSVYTNVAQLKGEGYKLLSAEKGKAYQYNELMPYETQMNYYMQQMGNIGAEIMGKRQARAQIWSSVISGISSIAGGVAQGAGSAGGIGALL